MSEVAQAISKTESDPLSTELPLCVDLDGTLVQVDTFYRSVWALLKRNLLYAFLFPFWLLKGKAFVKQQVSLRTSLSSADLPFNSAVISFIREQHKLGRDLYLASGADKRIVQNISESLGIFKGVLSSDGALNLTGRRKAAALEMAFGPKGFDYIGNSKVDLEVWKAARSAYVVTDAQGLVEQAKKISQVAGTFPHKNKGEQVESAGLGDYISIARPDHWFKNIFILPGIILALFFFPVTWSLGTIASIGLSIFATCLVASSNYVINEILDAEQDRFHPVKCQRPLASGRVSLPIAYTEWIVLGIVGNGLAFYVSPYVGAACLALWVMGCLYNIPPIRTKELPYLDVISESINNPLRMTIGWYSLGIAVVPPVSALFAYWMFGAFLMAIKRFAEYRRINDPELAAQYRHSFGYYNEERLISSSVFYIALFMTGAMAFVMLYRLELVFAVPCLAYLISYYLYLGFRTDSPVQYPELLYKEKHLMLALFVFCLWCTALFFMVDFPWFKDLFVLLTPRAY